MNDVPRCECGAPEGVNTRHKESCRFFIPCWECTMLVLKQGISARNRGVHEVIHHGPDRNSSVYLCSGHYKEFFGDPPKGQTAVGIGDGIWTPRGG